MLIGAAALGVALFNTASSSGQNAEPRGAALDERAEIQYATRPTTDRVARLNDQVRSGRALARETRTGYLRALLDALGLPVESQLLVFSKTGVQRAYIEQLNQAKIFRRPIATQVVALEQFYQAEAYHQDYAAKHQYEPYIAINDLPKVDALRKQLPDLYRK